MSKKRKILSLIISFMLILGLAGSTLAADNANGPVKKTSAKKATSKAAPKKPLKIGVLLPLSGVYTSLGETILQGMEIYFKEINYTIEGRKIQLIKEDEQNKAEVGLQKVRKMVESDKVDIIAGVGASPVGYAIRDYIHAKKVPLIIANAGAHDLTRSKGSPYIFRASFANGQYVYPLGPYAVKKLGIKTAVVLAPDYAAGHEKANEFMLTFKKSGGQVVQQLYLGQIQKADAVWAFFAGSDANAFVKQYKEFGLKDKYPLIGDSALVDEAFLQDEGDSALGVITSGLYTPTSTTAINKSFVARYKAAYGKGPGTFSNQGYVTAKVIGEALKATKGNTSDKKKLLAAIQKVKFEAPAGPFRFSKYQNVIFNTYIRTVKKVNGEYQNITIDTVKDTPDLWFPKAK